MFFLCVRLVGIFVVVVVTRCSCCCCCSGGMCCFIDLLLLVQLWFVQFSSVIQLYKALSLVLLPVFRLLFVSFRFDFIYVVCTITLL